MNPKIRKVCLLFFSSWYLNPSWASALHTVALGHTLQCPLPRTSISVFLWPFFGFGNTFLQRRSGVVEFTSPDILRLRDVNRRIELGQSPWTIAFLSLFFR